MSYFLLIFLGNLLIFLYLDRLSEFDHELKVCAKVFLSDVIRHLQVFIIGYIYHFIVTVFVLYDVVSTADTGLRHFRLFVYSFVLNLGLYYGLQSLETGGHISDSLGLGQRLHFDTQGRVIHFL